MELTINNQYGKRPWPGDMNTHHLSNHSSSIRSVDEPTCIIKPNLIDTQSNQPVKRVANERERTRTASVNDAFIMLRSLIPTEPINRKLSKIETLRLASSYISHLHAVLITGSNPTDQPCLHSPNPIPNRSVCTFCVTELKQHQQQKSMWNSNNHMPVTSDL